MTGPGTNSYLVGDPDTGYAVIDPGPADTEHLDRLWRAAGGNIPLHRVHPFAPRPLAGRGTTASHVRPAWAHTAHSWFGVTPQRTRSQRVHT